MHTTAIIYDNVMQYALSTTCHPSLPQDKLEKNVRAAELELASLRSPRAIAPTVTSCLWTMS